MNNRNETIFKRMANGESATALANEYNISRERVYQIVNKEKKKLELDSDPLFVAIRNAVNELNISDEYVFSNRLFNKLRRVKVTTIEELKELDLNAWENRWQVGPVHVEVVKKVLSQN